jgi:uncharacterized SAM-binding protein YcdF (DUF218 family)
MKILFVAKKLCTFLVLPPTGCVLLVAGGLLALRRMPRLALGFAWAVVISLFVLSLPIVSNGLMTLIGNFGVLNLSMARNAQAIVVLGGGVRINAPEYAGDTLSSYTLERVRYGAWVARRTGLPVLVSGGVVFEGTPEAQLMRAALEEEFGVPVRWVESASRDTHENAVFSAKLLRQGGVHHAILVTHGIDMRRARYEFETAGISVMPAPTVIPRARFDHLVDLIPSAAALYRSSLALHEFLGNVAYRLHLYADS